jgi:hypothetical protein
MDVWTIGFLSGLGVGILVGIVMGGLGVFALVDASHTQED